MNDHKNVVEQILTSPWQLQLIPGICRDLFYNIPMIMHSKNLAALTKYSEKSVNAFVFNFHRFWPPAVNIAFSLVV